MLNKDQLAALRQKNERTTTHGWPRQTILDLLGTIDGLKKEKKKWQRLADERGRAMWKIRELCETRLEADDVTRQES